MKRAAALLLSVLWTTPVACQRRSATVSTEADAAAPSAATVPAAGTVVREGLEIAFGLEPIKGPVEAHADATAVFTITDAATGAPARGLRPRGWMSRRQGAAPDEAACKAKVKGHVAGMLSARADVDMSAYHVWTLNRDGHISVIDPTVAFKRTQIEALVTLPARPADWALSADGAKVVVSLPDSGEAAIVGVRAHDMARVRVGAGPARVVAAPSGQRVWVGNDGDGTVSVVDVARGEVDKTISAFAGHHEIAFSDAGRTAWITSSADPRLLAVDAQSLEVLATIPVGRGAAAVAASDAAHLVYVAGEESGEVVAVDTARRVVSHRIALQKGLSAIRFDPTGLFAFAANRAAGEVAILDAAAGTVAHRLTGLGAPDAIAFTAGFAYVRRPAEAKMSVIELNTLARRGSLAVVDVPIGQQTDDAKARALGAPIAPLPEGGGVLVANPVDGNLYQYVEGMMAPVGSHRNYARSTEGLLIVDRSLSEVRPGVYAATVRLPEAGTYDVSILVGEPRFAACLEQGVPAATGPARAPAAPRITVEPLFDALAPLAAGEPATLRFRAYDAAGGAPIAPDEVDLLIVRFPGNHRFQKRAEDGGEGVMTVTFTPPVAGQYRLLPSVPTRKVPVGKIAYLTVGVAEKGEDR